MPTHTLTYSIQAGGDALAYPVASTAGSETNVSESVAESQTDYVIMLTVDVSTLKSWILHSTGACTVKTYSGVSLVDTFTVAANSPFVWHYGSPIALPFAGDFDRLKVTNTPAVTITVKCLQDPTP